MAAHGALPRALAKMSPRFKTPSVSTWAMGAASVLWWLILIAIDRSENILWDSISGLGFAIAFYYAITAIAAPILFRRHLFQSWKNFLLVGVAPLVGAGVLAWVFIKSAIDYFFWSPDTAYTPAWFAFGEFRGLGAPFVIGIGMLLAGIPLWLWARHAYPRFFSRRAEAAASMTDLLPDELRVTEETAETPTLETAPFEAPPVRTRRTPIASGGGKGEGR
jgi:amino acid transporter